MNEPSLGRSGSRARVARMFGKIARTLGRVESRLFLSAAIIVSLLPFGWVEQLDGLFLIIFAVEFALRASLIFRGEPTVTSGAPAGVDTGINAGDHAREWQRPSATTLLLLGLDLLALLSFVPGLVGLDTGDTRWLRVFRLSRMLLLLSYWAPLVRDVWSVMLARERAKQVVLMGFIVLALSFAGAVVIDQLRVVNNDVVDFDGDGVAGYDQAGKPHDPDDERFYVHIWWAFRQIQDPGNMLESPQHAAAVFVSLGLTTAGLFMVSFLIGLGTDVVGELMALSRLRPPGLRGHTIVVNIDVSTQQLLHELIRYSRKLIPTGSLSLRWVAKLLRNTQAGLRGARYLVVGRGDEPPEFLRQPDLAKIHYRQAQVEDVTFLGRTDVALAQRVVLLADLAADDPDASTIQALLTITQTLREADEKLERQPKRTRLLIAEILDESNIPAAHAAIVGSTDQNQIRAFVVPSERLLALFVACNTWRPGVGRLLEELLTSRGNELYTMFFELPGLGYQRPSRPTRAADPSAIMTELVQRSRSLASSKRVVPIGVLMSGTTDVGRDPGELEPVRVCVNPRGPAALASVGDSWVEPALAPNPNAQWLGFVAIASSFGRVCELADDLCDRPLEHAAAATPAATSVELPSFTPSPTTQLDKVLVCGFRSGTVSMVEALIQAQPSAQILIMVHSEASRASAWDDFDAHTQLVHRGLLAPPHGPFETDADAWALTWRPPNTPAVSRRPHVRIVVGDWSSSRQLTSLPLGFGEIERVDAVILISSERRGADARTAKALMKLETLTRTPRIVAEVLDVELARRLRRRSEQRRDSARVSVYSIQELRAFFMFQSVVVPAFDLVYAELMGPWGQNFARLELAPDAARVGHCSFEQLADHLALAGRVLIAVELCEGRGAHVHGPHCETTLNVAAGSEDDDRIDLERLVSVWVIARD